MRDFLIVLGAMVALVFVVNIYAGTNNPWWVNAIGGAAAYIFISLVRYR